MCAFCGESSIGRRRGIIRECIGSSLRLSVRHAVWGRGDACRRPPGGAAERDSSAALFCGRRGAGIRRVAGIIPPPIKGEAALAPLVDLQVDRGADRDAVIIRLYRDRVRQVHQIRATKNVEAGFKSLG